MVLMYIVDVHGSYGDGIFGTGVGAWLMHSLVQVWCMVDALVGIGIQLMLVWYRLMVWYG
jgi:hypothetical protein